MCKKQKGQVPVGPALSSSETCWLLSQQGDTSFPEKWLVRNTDNAHVETEDIRIQFLPVVRTVPMEIRIHSGNW